jgi:tyrosyl-tRNA synthetase
MGGGTTRVGDPSGKDDVRKLLTYEEIDANKECLKQTFARFVDFGAPPTGAIMVDNTEWLVPLNYIDFLRDVGRHFSVNRMLAMDAVKIRLDREHELSFLEFNYMVLQAYDFTELARRHGCILQLGGSDQWGNIVNGIELGRRIDGAELYGITTPLITTADGAKMGKSVSGAVWLHEDQLPSYDYWQFWRNTDDRDVGRFLRLFTDLPIAEIERLEKLDGAEINAAKKILADEATAMCRGVVAAAAAAETARRTFDEGESGDALPSLKVIGGEIGIIEANTALGFAASNGEARRKIAEGAVRVDDEKVTDPTYRIVIGDQPVKLSLGKKRHALLTK